MGTHKAVERYPGLLCQVQVAACLLVSFSHVGRSKAHPCQPTRLPSVQQRSQYLVVSLVQVGTEAHIVEEEARLGSW